MSSVDAGLARFPRSRLTSKSFVKFVSQKPKIKKPLGPVYMEVGDPR